MTPPASASSPLLQLVGLSKSFGKLDAVKEISVTLSAGEIRGLIGPNGSGKTTLFNLISGFLKPTAGQILWRGEEIAGLAPHRIARLGIVRTFQLTSVYGDLTVMENLLMSSHLGNRSGVLAQSLQLPSARAEERRLSERCREILDEMGLTELADSRAANLAGGTQKILGIANALAADPILLMLDEPLAGLNPAEKTALMEKIETLRARGLTILIVEHDMKAVMTTCDRVTVICYGEKIAEGTPQEVSRDQRTIEAYLGQDEAVHA
ncbi:MAG: ABC transporter ATP-binding protein [Kiloniellales bacterium]